MKTLYFSIMLMTGLALCPLTHSQEGDLPLSKESYTQEELQEDFIRFREILEKEHCCLYEYTSKQEMDSLFDAHFMRISREMSSTEFFALLATITARIGCMHTSTWMPGRFFNTGRENMFPLKIKLIGPYAVVTGSYNASDEIPYGSILLDINDKPIDLVLDQLRQITPGDALNPYFKDAQLTHRFSMFFASLYGFPERYKIRFAPPGRKSFEDSILSPAHIDSVRAVVFSHFQSPPLEFEILEEFNCARMTISTFVYYDKVDYFRDFMDSCFHLIHDLQVNNLILDLRKNGGGDPYCAADLFSYLQPEPSVYFAESYRGYQELASPIPMPAYPFKGNLYTLIDGSCGSTNGHFCALLKHHRIGKFVGTPSGATYKCNAGRDTEFQLENTGMIVTIGRSTYAVAVQDMDKSSPIMPDIAVKENYKIFLEGRDQFIEAALLEIEMDTL